MTGMRMDPDTQQALEKVLALVKTFSNQMIKMTDTIKSLENRVSELESQFDIPAQSFLDKLRNLCK